MDFEWDQIKESANQKKHGISFNEASEVFSDEYSSCIPDPDHSYGEERFLLFGISLKGNYFVVSFVERIAAVRIISARPMTRQERKAYEQ